MFSRASKKVWVLVVVALLISVLLVWLVLGNHKAGLCLTINDYQDLTGSKAVVANSTQNFYDYTLAFNENSASYSSSDSFSGSGAVAEIGNFYKSHGDQSIVIDITSIYNDIHQKDLAEERSQKIVDDLASFGVSESDIIVNEPEYISAEPDSMRNITNLSIKSAADCRYQ